MTPARRRPSRDVASGCDQVAGLEGFAGLTRPPPGTCGCSSAVLPRRPRWHCRSSPPSTFTSPTAAAPSWQWGRLAAPSRTVGESGLAGRGSAVPGRGGVPSVRLDALRSTLHWLWARLEPSAHSSGGGRRGCGCSCLALVGTRRLRLRLLHVSVSTPQDWSAVQASTRMRLMGKKVAELRLLAEEPHRRFVPGTVWRSRRPAAWLALAMLLLSQVKAGRRPSRPFLPQHLDSPRSSRRTRTSRASPPWPSWSRPPGWTSRTCSICWWPRR